MGCNILKLSNYIMFKGELLEHNHISKNYFKMDNQIWVLQTDKKIRVSDFKGELISNFAVSTI
jgi:hypothetical protein